MKKVILKTKTPNKVILKDGKIAPPSVFRPTDTSEEPGKSTTPKTKKR